MAARTDGKAKAGNPAVAGLLEERERLLDWLRRIDEVRGEEESDRVVSRVRADYEGRLERVVTALSGHLEELRGQAGAARERLGEAEERAEAARDALLEARLRNRIGEVPDEEWESARERLESGVAEAERLREEAAAEVEGLAEVVGQIEPGVVVQGGGPDLEATVPEGRPATKAAPPAAPVAASRKKTPPPPEETIVEPGGPLEQDLAFLEELDRAIAASSELTDPQPEEEQTVAGPARGAKCPECGYTNDSEAWYCGVCGVDLA